MRAENLARAESQAKAESLARAASLEKVVNLARAASLSKVVNLVSQKMVSTNEVSFQEMKMMKMKAKTPLRTKRIKIVYKKGARNTNLVEEARLSLTLWMT